MEPTKNRRGLPEAASRIDGEERALALREPAVRRRGTLAHVAGAVRGISPWGSLVEAYEKTLEHRAECKRIALEHVQVLVAAQHTQARLELSFALRTWQIRRSEEAFERLAALAERDAEAARAAVALLLQAMAELRTAAVSGDLPLEVRLRLLDAHCEMTRQLGGLQDLALRPLARVLEALPRFQVPDHRALGAGRTGGSR